jgi:predicted Zn finger-like uncharacterized protein
MKVACQQCGTAYSVADEKVAGRRVKLRCKHCSEPMIIDGTTLQGSADVTPAVALQPTADQVTPVFLESPIPSRASSAPPYSPPPTAEVGAAWHVAVGEGSQGPYTLDELASYVADGRIASDTLVYCESFADWTPAGAVEELMIAANALQRPRPSAPPPPPPQLTPTPYQRSAGMGRDPFEEREPAPASPRLRAEEIFDSKHEGTVQFSLDDIRAISAVSAPSLVALPVSPSSYTAPGYTSSAGQSAPGYASGEGSGLIDVASLSAADPGPYRSIASDTHVSPLEGMSHITPMAVPILGGRPQGLDARTKVFAGLSAFGFVLVAAVAVIALSRTPAPQPVSVAAATATPIAQPAVADAPAAAEPAQDVEKVAKAEPQQPEPAAEPARDEPEAKGYKNAARELAAADDTRKSSRSSRRDRKHADDDASEQSSRSSARHGKDKDKDALPLAKAEEPKPAKTGAKAASSGTDIDDILAAPAKKPAKGGSPSIDDLLDGAVAAKKSPPKAEPAEPKNDLPMTPSRDDMLAALGKAKAKVAKCKGDGVATADISISGNGKVANIAVSGVDGATKSCVESAVRGTTFPKFQKDSFQVKFPFKLAGG